MHAWRGAGASRRTGRCRAGVDAPARKRQGGWRRGFHRQMRGSTGRDHWTTRGTVRNDHPQALSFVVVEHRNNNNCAPRTSWVSTAPRPARRRGRAGSTIAGAGGAPSPQWPLAWTARHAPSPPAQIGSVNGPERKAALRTVVSTIEPVVAIVFMIESVYLRHARACEGRERETQASGARSCSCRDGGMAACAAACAHALDGEGHENAAESAHRRAAACHNRPTFERTCQAGRIGRCAE